MKKKLLLGLLAAAAVSFTACQKDEVISEMPQDNAIGFGTYVGRDAQTKADVTNIGTMENADYAGFGVFAYYTGTTDYTDGQTSFAPSFMNNVRVYYQSGWKYDNKKYWPNSTEKISFFAYAPHVATADAIITGFSNETTKADPTINFTTPTDVEDQIDLLYANNKNQTQTDGTVEFTFNHALSRIGFKVKTERTDYRVTISKITLTGDFNTSGTLNLCTGTWSGEDTEANQDTYELTFNTANNINSTSGTAIEATEGYVMAIPTTFEESSKLNVSVNYTYQYEVSTGVWSTATSDTKNGSIATTFAKGNAYTLVMTLDPLQPIEFTVTSVEGWSPEDGTNVAI